MAFIRIPGVTGMVYVPEQLGEKKNNCPDCYCCLQCSDERCELCLKRGCSDCSGEKI